MIAKAYHQQNLSALHTKKNLQILEQIDAHPLLDAALMSYKISLLWRLIFENQYTHEKVDAYLYELVDTLNQQYLHQKYLAEIDFEVLKGSINFAKDLSFFSEEGIVTIEELPKNIQLFKSIKGYPSKVGKEICLKIGKSMKIVTKTVFLGKTVNAKIYMEKDCHLSGKSQGSYLARSA